MARTCWATAVNQRPRKAAARAAQQSGSHLVAGWVRLRPVTTRKVLRSGSDASGIVMPAAFPRAQVAHHGFVEPLSWQNGGRTGRVGADHLGGDAPDRVADLFGLGEERVAGRHRLFQVQLFQGRDRRRGSVRRRRVSGEAFQRVGEAVYQDLRPGPVTVSTAVRIKMLEPHVGPLLADPLNRVEDGCAIVVHDPLLPRYARFTWRFDGLVRVTSSPGSGDPADIAAALHPEHLPPIGRVHTLSRPETHGAAEHPPALPRRKAAYGVPAPAGCPVWPRVEESKTQPSGCGQTRR